MKRRNNIIFLLGNGFDLSHNLKTSYRDFILDYLKKSIISAVSNESDTFSDDCFTIRINKYPDLDNRIFLDFFNHKIESNTLYQNIARPEEKIRDIKQGEFYIFPKGRFIWEILINCLSSDWNGIEDAIYKEIKQTYLGLKSEYNVIEINPKMSSSFQFSNKKIEELNSAVDCLKKNLIEYLKPLNNIERYNLRYFNKNLIWGKVVNQQRIEPTFYTYDRDVLFLNFNYTDYYIDMIDKLKGSNEDYYTKYDFINIHGSIKDRLENIVFGIGDEQNEFYHRIESFFGDSWLKNMKSFHYFRQDNYQKLLGFINKGDYEIYVLGHSCSITDRTLLNMLFENDFCKKINVYHHNGIESYMKTAYNISRNFINKTNLRKVLMPYNTYLDLKL